ncbi:hypothetical protein AGMMS50284_1990 [Clostridia bacterium]|nr:hypothetical protein AGMMS50284_1990 [Clostridia bacterium]
MEKHEKKLFLKNVSYSFIANVISTLLGILAVLIFPKFIGVKPYAYYQLYVFYGSYVVISALGLADGVYLEIGGKKYNSLNKPEQTNLFWFMSFVQTALYVLILVFAVSFTSNPDKKMVYILVCVLAIAINPRYYLQLVLQATNRIKESSIVIITERLIAILITAIALLLGCKSYLFLIILDVVGRFISCFISMVYCKDIVFNKPKISKETIKQAKKFISSGFMLLFAGQASALVLFSVRSGIEYHWNIETFGKISLTIALSTMVLRCINAAAVVMFPALRNTDPKKVNSYYLKINTLLMVVIFAALIFYNPAAILLSVWLPKYADAIRYAAILLPMCVYSCKNAILVTTYIKTIRKERILFWTNLIAIAASCVCTLVFVFILNSLELTVLSIFLVTALRCNIAELWLNKTLKISILKDMILEFLMCAIFIICNWFFGWAGTVVYTFCFIIYAALLKRKDITQTIGLVIKKKN